MMIHTQYQGSMPLGLFQTGTQNNPHISIYSKHMTHRMWSLFGPGGGGGFDQNQRSSMKKYVYHLLPMIKGENYNYSLLLIKKDKCEVKVNNIFKCGSPLQPFPNIK